MLEVDFITFQDLLTNTNKINPAVNCLETSSKFVFIFKTEEAWEYFTVISKSKILDFGNLYTGDEEEAMNTFRLNYCTNTVPLVSNKGISKSVAPLIEKGIITKSDVIDAGENIIEESDNYETFLSKIVDQWEKETIKALDELTPVVVDKTFNEFFGKITSTFNTKRFLTAIAKFVKQGLVKGMESAEEELDVQIGYTQLFQQKLQVLSDQQLSGYTINGKKWHGIKGVTQDIQVKILKSVRDDVINKTSRSDMVKNIQEIYQGAGKTHAQRIARTETNRFINEGKMTGYKESGFKLKSWSTVGDTHVSEIDKRLESTYSAGIPLDDPFIDEVSGKAFMTPPSHPNCRCTISAVFKEKD